MKNTIGSLLLIGMLSFGLMSGCSKHQVTRHDNPHGQDQRDDPQGPTQPGNGESQVSLNRVSNWTIGYAGREDYQENSGIIVPVERIKVSGTGGERYLVSLISVADYDATYNGDLLSFLQDEAGRTDANGEAIEAYTQDPHDILFDRLHSGEWYGYIIGVDAQGKANGKYNYSLFTIAQETPSEAYAAFLGQWSISRGNVAYPITISQDDANYTYRVDGWETGNSIDSQDGTVMDQEWLITYFDDGRMYFVSSLIGNYDDEGLGNVDEIFMGQVNYMGVLGQKGLYIIDQEGLDLAYAEMGSTAGTADIYPCEITAVFDWGKNGVEEVPTRFHSMQYMAYAFDSQAYYLYNQNVPALPLSMNKISDATPSTKASDSPARSKKDLLRSLPREHRDKENRAIVSAVSGNKPGYSPRGRR